MRKLTRTALATTAVAGLLALPVAGATAADTSATITVSSSGALNISSPTGTVNLGSANYSDADPTALASWATGTNLTDLQTALSGQADIVGQLGAVTVVDGRLGLVTSWTSTVSWTDFKLDGTGNTATTVIAQDQLRYNSGAATTSGVGTFAPQLAAVQSGGDAASYVGVLQVSGSNTVAWNPTIYVDLQGEEAGVYSGTITHSVTGS